MQPCLVDCGRYARTSVDLVITSGGTLFAFGIELQGAQLPRRPDIFRRRAWFDVGGLTRALRLCGRLSYIAWHGIDHPSIERVKIANPFQDGGLVLVPLSRQRRLYWFTSLANMPGPNEITHFYTSTGPFLPYIYMRSAIPRSQTYPLNIDEAVARD